MQYSTAYEQGLNRTILEFKVLWVSFLATGGAGLNRTILEFKVETAREKWEQEKV